MIFSNSLRRFSSNASRIALADVVEPAGVTFQQLIQRANGLAKEIKQVAKVKLPHFTISMNVYVNLFL